MITKGKAWKAERTSQTIDLSRWIERKKEICPSIVVITPTRTRQMTDSTTTSFFPLLSIYLSWVCVWSRHLSIDKSSSLSAWSSSSSLSSPSSFFYIFNLISIFFMFFLLVLIIPLEVWRSRSFLYPEGHSAPFLNEKTFSIAPPSPHVSAPCISLRQNRL